MFDNVPNLFENVPQEHRPGPDTVASGQQAVGSPDGLGTSPDGLGAYARPVSRAPAHGVDQYQYPTGMHGELSLLEPADTSPQAAVRSAGVTALVAAVAFGGGLALGGPWGGVSGIMLSGSFFNGYRAQKWWGSNDPSEKSEAVVSAIFGAIGICAGGYAAYKAYQSKEGS